MLFHIFGQADETNCSKQGSNPSPTPNRRRMMTRLVAFGCSYTYGHSLEDCHIPPNLQGHYPSKTAWPNKLAEHLGISEVVNNGICGASNKSIWKNVVEFDFIENDIVVINWTFLTRHSFFNVNPDEDLFILPRDLSYKWFYENLYSNYDSILELLCRADHAKRYLDSRNIRNFHALLSITHVNTNICDWSNVQFLNVDFDTIRHLHPYALDGAHPSQAAHDQYANELHAAITSSI